MEANQVVPRYEELLKDTGVIFVHDEVTRIDLENRQVELKSGTQYPYSNLVLSVGSITGYFGIEGAKAHSFPLRSRADAIAIDRHLRQCLQEARETSDSQRRRQLLTVATIGAGPSGVEMAGTLADLLPKWYESMGGDPQEVRAILLDRESEILQGDLNDSLREVAWERLQKRTVPVEIILDAPASAVRPDAVEYRRGDRSETQQPLPQFGPPASPLIP
jgi:NADH dehydrogenase